MFIISRFGRTRLRGGGVAAIVGGMVVATLPLTALTAGAAVTTGGQIETFTTSNLLGIRGYAPNTNVEVEVLRQNIVIGSTTKTTDGEGNIELNHVGGADCFDGPTSPDVAPGDTIRATQTGAPADTSLVRGLWFDELTYGVDTITASGRVALTGPTAVKPGTDILELRFRKGPPREWDDPGVKGDLRVDIGADVGAGGSWSTTVNVSAQDVAEHQAGGEAVLEWAGVEAGETEITVAEFGEAEALDCPPLQEGPTAPQLAPSQDSGKRGDHITNRSTNLTFSGLAGTGLDGAQGPGADVTLMVNGTQKATGVADAQGVYRFAGVTLAPGATHSLQVRSETAGEPVFTSATRRVRIDNTRPGVRMRSFRPNPLHLAGRERARAVYRISEASLLQTKVQRVTPRRTVQTFRNRSLRSAALVEVFWNGKNRIRRDVRPGRYQMVLTVTDRAGNRSVQTNRFRVVR